MKRFIELSDIDGKRTIINVNWIEEVREMADGTCTIYFAFQEKDAISQDHYCCTESYEVIREELKIMERL